MKKVLIIVRGLPGSGKSTLAEMFGDENVYEADHFFYNEDGDYIFDATKLRVAHETCIADVTSSMLANGFNHNYFNKIVVSNTSNTEKEMEPYLNLAKQFGYDVISLIVENRREGKSVHNVPEETIEKMRSRFQIKL